MNQLNELKKLINKEYTVRNMCIELKIDPAELYFLVDQLKKEGLYYYPKTDLDAETKLTLKKENSDADLSFRVSDGEFSFLVISDPHIGSIYDAPHRFKLVNDFLNEHEINMLVNTGDLIDGPVHEDQSLPRRIERLDDQVYEFADLYPYMVGTNVVVLGDHDLKYKNKEGISANKLLRGVRPDLRVFSSGSGIININNNKILVAHNTKDPRVIQRITNDMIVISGHSHAYYNNTLYSPNKPIIRIVSPSMSDLPTYNNKVPGFLKFNLSFDANILYTVVIENYVFYNNDTYLNGTTTYNMPTTNRQRSRKNR